jgi:hypothetical protein
MSGDHTKREIVTGDKPGENPLEGVRPQAQGGILFLHQVPSERQQEEEDEESGLLRDRLFVALHLRLRLVIRNF